MSWIRRGLRAAAREPLVHFALLGAVLLVLYRVLAPDGREIVISTEVVRGLREDHRRRNGAAPSAAEEAGLVQRYVDNEILYREALALGLDRGDIIVRRRLIQKMELLAESLGAPAAPTQAQLVDYLRTHAADYAVPDRIDFIHVFVRSDGASADAAARAHELRQALLAGAAPESLGDPFLRGAQFSVLSAPEVAAIFGDEMAAAVFALADDEWSAPLRSAYGYHLVRITARQPARVPQLDEVRDLVTRAWSDAQREAAIKAELQRLRDQYRVRVEGSLSEGGG